jgi:hypothetical protein
LTPISRYPHSKRICNPLSHPGENRQQPILRGRQRAVLIHAKLAGGPRCPIETPRGEMHLERRLTERDEALKRVELHADAIEKLGRAGLHIGALDTDDTWCLLSGEAQYTIIEINSIKVAIRGGV